MIFVRFPLVFAFLCTTQQSCAYAELKVGVLPDVLVFQS